MVDLDEIRATLSRIPNPVGVLESLFALAPVGFQIYDKNGRSMLVNQAFRDLFGSEPPPGYCVLNDEIAERNGVLETIRRAFRGETVTTPPIWYDPRELKQVHVSHGRRVGMSATFFPLFDRQGAVSHVGIVFRDLTAEMTRAEQLEGERELLSAIVDQVADAIIMADASGRFQVLNRAARALGLTEGTGFAQSGGQALRDADGTPIPDHERPLSRALRGEASSAVVRYTPSDGRERVLSAHAVPLRRPDGSIRGAVVALRDETERAALETEAKVRAQFREQFIGVLGHDLRSPLTAIQASAGLILRHQDVPEPTRAAARRISASGARMARMISDLLDFTQARLGGGLPTRRKPADLRAVVETVLEEARAAAPDREVRLEVRGDTRGSFDADRVAQLASNLVQNALAYSSPGTPVVVELRGEEQTVLLAVSNEGPPLSPEEQRTIFDPFRRGAQPHGRGLGLGLYIVEQIARAHGGTIAVESGERVTFRATLHR